MMEFKEVCIVVWALAWAGMIGRLLFVQKLTAWGASLLLGAAGGFLLLVLNVDTVSSIAISWGKAMDLRVETKQMRDEVFAKAEYVRALGEQVARFAAHTVATSGRWVGEDHQNRMLEERERIKTMMKSLGSAPDRIDEVLNEIDKMVEWDLKQKIVEIVERIHKPNQKGSDQLLEELQSRLSKYDSPASHNSLVTFLKERNTYDSSVEKAIQRVDLFLTEKHL